METDITVDVIDVTLAPPARTDITLTATDDTGKQLFSYKVPFTPRINVTQLLQSAFVLNQTSTTDDPFTYTLEFFGYSQSAKYPGYLGYEVESINGYASSTAYWSLSVNSVTSDSGIDTTYPNPGATVSFTYTDYTGDKSTGGVGADAAAPSRASVIQALRANRLSRSAGAS